MTHTTSPLPSGIFSVGCYRARLAELNGELVYTNGNAVRKTDGSLLLDAQSEILDIAKCGDGVVCVTDNGDLFSLSSDSQIEHLERGLHGEFSAVEVSDSFVITAHSLSHSVHVFDKKRLALLSELSLPGLLNGLSVVDDGLIATADDRTLSIIDPRTPSFAQRSSPLVSAPTCIYATSHKLVVACEDRRVKIHDIRNLKAAARCTKPATKNGCASVWLTDGGDVICIGSDERMTFVKTSEDVGQLHRKKFLAETPWISCMSKIGDGYSLLTRGGMVHHFIDPATFLNSQ